MLATLKAERRERVKGFAGHCTRLTQRMSVKPKRLLMQDFHRWLQRAPTKRALKHFSMGLTEVGDAIEGECDAQGSGAGLASLSTVFPGRRARLRNLLDVCKEGFGVRCEGSPYDCAQQQRQKECEARHDQGSSEGKYGETTSGLLNSSPLPAAPDLLTRWSKEPLNNDIPAG